MSLSFFVPGTPAPQGSKRHVGRGILVESSNRLKPWREDIRQSALDAAEKAAWVTVDGPICVTVTFWVPRPKSHPKTRRTWPTSRAVGDLDKLQRGLLDALTSASVIEDDSLVVGIYAWKRYVHPPSLRLDTEPDRTGADITIERTTP